MFGTNIIFFGTFVKAKTVFFSYIMCCIKGCTKITLNTGEITLEWIGETIACNPASGLHMNDICKFVYSTIREGKKFPIRNEEAFEVARVTELIRKAAGQE